MFSVKINNITENDNTYYAIYPYIVATVVDNELWFYGAYKTEENAKKALDENKIIVKYQRS
jgi:hypothetical protein